MYEYASHRKILRFKLMIKLELYSFRIWLRSYGNNESCSVDLLNIKIGKVDKADNTSKQDKKINESKLIHKTLKTHIKFQKGNTLLWIEFQ